MGSCFAWLKNVMGKKPDKNPCDAGHGKESKSSRPATVHDLQQVEDRILTALGKTEREIMSALSDFLAKQKAFNDRQAKAIDDVVAGVAGVTTDVATLNQKIVDLQNSLGDVVTPEDKVAIASLVEQGEAVATKLEAASTALTALDAANPPPTVPPPA